MDILQGDPLLDSVLSKCSVSELEGKRHFQGGFQAAGVLNINRNMADVQCGGEPEGSRTSQWCGCSSTLCKRTQLLLPLCQSQDACACPVHGKMLRGWERLKSQ